MPSTYTIEQLGQKAVWENDQNKGDYPAILSGVEGEVLMFHDSSSDFDPPKIGDEVFGEIKPNKARGGGQRFSYKPRSSPGGHSPRGGGGKGGGYSPGDIARITRSHSQEMAVRLIAASGAAQGLDPANATDAGPFLNGVVARLADWFDADVAKAEAAVKGAESTPAPVSRAEEVPADREGLDGQPAPTRADDQIPF